MTKNRFFTGLLSTAVVLGGLICGTTSAMAATDAGASRGTATALTAGTTYTETSATPDYAIDVDWFKVTTKSDGRVSFTFQQDPNDTHDIGWGWFLTVYDEDGNVVDDKVQIDNSRKYVTAEFGYPANTTLYLKVECNSAFMPDDGTAYNVTANVTADTTWETEYNNSKAAADNISLDQKYHGTLMTYQNTGKEDVDFYKVYAKAGKLNVTLNSNAYNESEIKYGWKVSILDANLNELSNVTTLTKDSATATISKAGYYYIKVETGSSWSSDYDAVYDISAMNIVKVSEVSSTPKKAYFTVKWSAVSGAKGYQIRYSKKSSMTSAKTVSVTSGTSKKISGLKSKTQYYVQIRAYKKNAIGKIVYGSWSSSKSIRTK